MTTTATGCGKRSTVCAHSEKRALLDFRRTSGSHRLVRRHFSRTRLHRHSDGFCLLCRQTVAEVEPLSMRAPQLAVIADSPDQGCLPYHGSHHPLVVAL